MMYTLVCSDGAVYHGRTMAGVVSAMKKDSWNAPEQKQPYMYEVIERVCDITNARWPGGPPTPKTFLYFLVGAGLVRLSKAI